MYSVIVGPTQQRRNQVPLENLRTPFKEGDPIEYYSSDEFRWMAGSVAGMRRNRGHTIAGYSVHIDELHMKLPRVPSARLRPRFPVGSKVKVYRSLATGWESAKILDMAPADMEHIEMMPIPVTDL